MTVGSLFSGIGGFDLGFERAGFDIRWQVEIDDYANRVLAKHWPDVRRYRDVRVVTGAELGPTDVICGGFPCQPHSLAGRRGGSDDERDLWPEFARLIREVRPRWIVAENVPGLLSSESGRFFGTVLGDLAEAGYDAEWDCISALAVGAPHRRDRVWLVAYPMRDGWGNKSEPECRRSDSPDSCANGSTWPLADTGCELRGTVRDAEAWASSERQQAPTLHQRCSADVADADAGRQPIEWLKEHTEQQGALRRESDGCRAGRPWTGPDVELAHGQRREHPSEGDARPRVFSEGERIDSALAGAGWWDVEPNVGRVAHGIPARVDRLRGLGNAIVPQIAQWIAERIKAAEGLAG